MTQAKQGDTVRIHYTGRLTDGTQFDSSDGRDPLEFQLGSGQIIKGLEEQVQGMSVGAKETVTIPADAAYGAIVPKVCKACPGPRFPRESTPRSAPVFRPPAATDQTMVLTVIDTSEEEITVDANHPLAGKDLIFDVELVEVL